VSFFFTQPATQWAITQILQLTTRDQLHLVLHILGYISSNKADHCTLSLSRIARDLGYSRQTVKPIKARLIKANLITELATPGKPSLYSLGPATRDQRFNDLITLFDDLANQHQLTWPFNGGQRAGAAAINALPDQSERSGGDQSERSGGVISQSDQVPDQLERSPIETSRDVSSKTFLESSPAEVEPQASASGYGPAEISAEQPEQPKAEIRFEEPQDQLPVEESSDNVVITANDVTLERVDSSTVDLAEPVAAPCNWVQPGDALMLNQSIYHVATFREGYIVVRDTADELFLATPWELQAEQQDAAPSAQCRNVSSAAQSILSSIRTA